MGWLMVCWCVVRRHGIASLVKRYCILVLEVELWHAARALVMRFLFVMERYGDWIVGVGSMMLTLVIRGSKPGILACILCLCL
jgi:hypothetical protein